MCIEAPPAKSFLDDGLATWDAALTTLVAKHVEYQAAEAYILRDDFKTKIYSAYIPEPDTEDVSPINAIRLLRSQDEGPIEISQVLTRLQAVTNKHPETVRYYVPSELRSEVAKLREGWKS